MSGLTPGLGLAPSASLPPSSGTPAPTITGGSDGYTLSTDPAFRRIDDIIYADSPGGGRWAFHGATLTRREYHDTTTGRFTPTLAAHHEHFERRATPNAFYGHAGACEATTTRDDTYDEEALLMLLARI